MHIHYTQGPPILADISKEESDAIIALIDQDVNCEFIQEQFNCSAEVVEALRDIHDKVFYNRTLIANQIEYINPLQYNL